MGVTRAGFKCSRRWEFEGSSVRSRSLSSADSSASTSDAEVEDGERDSSASRAAPVVKNPPPFDISLIILFPLAFPLAPRPSKSNSVERKEERNFIFSHLRISHLGFSLVRSVPRSGMPAKTHKAVALPLVDAGAQLKQAKALDKVAKKERKLAKAAAQEAAVAVEAPADVEMTTEDSSAALEAKAARKAAKKDKKKMQALQQVAQDVEMTPAAPALPKSSKRKALDVEPVVPAKKSKLVATSESAPLSPVASTSAVQPAPVAAVNKVYTAPARPVYARSVTDLNIPGVSAPRPAPSPSPTKKTTTQAPALHSSLLDADDDAVLAALQRVGLRKSPPHVSPVKKTAAASAKGKGKETNEETPEEMKARTKAEKKEAKRLAKELAANPPPLPAADAPEDLLADALASYKSTIPVIPREVVVKRKPVKIAVVKAGKAAKAPKEGKAPKMSLDDLASLDVKELLCTKFLTGAQVKALAEKKGSFLPSPL